MGVPLGAFAAGTPRRLPHGDVVVRQGDPIDCLFLVTRGVVRLSCVTRDGREVVVAVLGAGDLFGESALLGHPSPVEARTIGSADVVALPLDHLREIMRRHPATSGEMLRLVASRLHRTSQALQDAMVETVATRVSNRLRDLADVGGVRAGDEIRIALPLTQDEIASMVGATREAVNRTLGGLVSRGLLRRDGRAIVLPDPEALEEASRR